MQESSKKYVFWSLLAIVLAFILITSRHAGITCDEVLHYNQSVDVLQYFLSGGEDKAALHNPVWHLSYYGQSYDNIVTFIAYWLDIEDIYSLRHFMSSLAGWLVVVVTALFARWLSGYRTAIISIFLLAVTPSFLGHSHNNLKDIPFALGYISTAFFILRLVKSDKRKPLGDIILLTLSIAFTISIRAAGAVVILYSFFFLAIYYLAEYFKGGYINRREVVYKTVVLALVSFSGYFLSILLWPYALQDPLRNVYEAYRVMAHFPDTFRQLFEGKVLWSDSMPWYYLPKSMLITVPVLVTAGLILFVVLSFRKSGNRKIVEYFFLAFTVFFPVLFAILGKSNLYSSWRQFLFIYPALVIFSATGLDLFYKLAGRTSLKIVFIFLLLAFSVHPIKYMLSNPAYSYMYYNQLTGGLSGAYGYYENDYYFVSQTEASEWLLTHLKKKNITGRVKVAATYSVAWQFRNKPETETSFIRFEERSQSDWDYAIIVNRYIHPEILRKKLWPDPEALHVIYVDGVPVCEILERKTKDDFYGYLALERGDYRTAADFFYRAERYNSNDEMFFYNFATALRNNGDKEGAGEMLKRSLSINPDFEPALMYLGNIAVTEGIKKEAVEYYSKVLSVNKKYFEAYVEQAELYKESDMPRARMLLRSCLEQNPHFRPAIKSLADTYRISDPEIAEKYDKLADSVK